MIESQFNALRGESYISNIEHVNKEHYKRVLNKQFTRKSLTEWMNAAREPWRLYFPHRPDDMPPKGGDPEALRTLKAQFGPEHEEPAVLDPWGLRDMTPDPETGGL